MYSLFGVYIKSSMDDDLWVVAACIGYVAWEEDEAWLPVGLALKNSSTGSRASVGVDCQQRRTLVYITYLASELEGLLKARVALHHGWQFGFVCLVAIWLAGFNQINETDIWHLRYRPDQTATAFSNVCLGVTAPEMEAYLWC